MTIPRGRRKIKQQNRLFPHSWTTIGRLTLNHLCQKGGQSVLYPTSLAASALLWFLVTLPLSGCAGPNAAFQSNDGRDFPPLVDPDAPVAIAEPSTGTAETAGSVTGTSEFQPSDRVRIPTENSGFGTDDYAYRLGVADEISVVVIGHPDFTRPVKVLPDGSISSTGTGTIYVLGMTVPEATREVEERLKKTLRYPQVDLVVTAYGEHVIYAMGEVTIPADHPYRKGMTALQAVAAAGGFKDSAKRTNVCIFRRTGPDVAEFIQVDLKDQLNGAGLANDVFLRPYDIIYVPKSKIGNVNTFIDQYFRQNLSALNFYLTGWDAYSVTKDRVTIRRN